MSALLDSFKEWTRGIPNQDWERLFVHTCHFLWKPLGMKSGCHCISVTVIVQNALTELAKRRVAQHHDKIH